jgi:hypothetical protein
METAIYKCKPNLQRDWSKQYGNNGLLSSKYADTLEMGIFREFYMFNFYFKVPYTWDKR